MASSHHSQELTEFEKIQLEKSIDVVNGQVTLLTQIFVGLLAGNVALIGFAVDKQISGLFMAGAGFQLFMLVMIHMSKRLVIVPAFITAIAIESKHASHSSLMSSFAQLALSPDFFHETLKAVHTEKESERLQALRKLPKYISFPARHLMLSFSILSLVAQLGGPLIAYFGWCVPLLKKWDLVAPACKAFLR